MRRAIAFSLIVLAAACGERKSNASADSSLAADIALAQQTQAQPVFSDTSFAPSPAPAETKAPAPRPAARRQADVGARRQPTVVNRVAVKPAQTPAPVQESPSPAPSAAPAPAPASQIGAGTSFGVTSGSRVCTTTNRPGDKIIATINSPVVGSNGAVIPAGSTVVLDVATATGGDNPSDAQITFRIRSIDIGDQAHRADGHGSAESGLERTEIAQDRNADRRRVVTGAVAGAIIGQIMGRDTRSTVIGAATGAAAGAAASVASKRYQACLPAGATIQVTLDQPLPLSS